MGREEGNREIVIVIVGLGSQSRKVEFDLLRICVLVGVEVSLVNFKAAGARLEHLDDFVAEFCFA